ncbi:PREDICTED: F-box/kelch-repeat protein At3g06240-like [Prunus mume]|uniref:F-box/kelch-repeat protein At3g06240-like n=1 Tax=Prunus mume TaxID=102107 RepID=A0ABM0P013_PRUMU|nr:PREDICTED: F-box/kelch-repeat protein At3g06240-like [Prunus mume]
MVSPKDIPHEILFDIIAKLPVKSLLKFRCEWFLFLRLWFLQWIANLLCISDTTKETTYLWNPSIRKFKRLPRGLIRVKYRYSDVATIALGFGLDVGGNDYKVVRVGDFLHGVCVEVYSLRLDSWRIIHAVPPVTEIFEVFWSNKWTYLNGVVYWIVQEFFPDCRYIISFDMENEIFQRIMLPDRLLAVTDSISIRVLEKSLSLFHRRQESDREYHYYDIWVLEMDSWKMIRTIPVPSEGKIAWPLAFTANGGVHFTTYGNWQHRKLELYDPKSEQVTDTGIKLGNYGGTRRRIYGYSESLVLLN